MQTAEQIAALLTDMQRAALLGPENVEMGAGTAFALIRHGMIEADPHDVEGWRWTILGLAVRTIIKDQNNEQ